MITGISRWVNVLKNPSNIRCVSTQTKSHATNARAQAARKERKAAQREALNLQRQMESLFDIANPIVGYNPRNPEIWKKSLVKQNIVTPQEIWGPQSDTIMGESQQQVVSQSAEISEARKIESNYASFPERLNFRLSEDDVTQITKQLPLGVAWESALTSETLVSDLDNRRKAMAMAQEITTSEPQFLRILDLRNANAQAINAYNRRNLMKLFRRHENDTASPEVLAAVYTGEIYALLQHLVANRKDVYASTHLRRKVNLRCNALLYLKKKSPLRFNELLPKLGMLPSSVEREMHLSRATLKEAVQLVIDNVH